MKWREASWKLFTYAMLTACGLASCRGVPWVSDTAQLWQGWPYDQVRQLSRCLVAQA